MIGLRICTAFSFFGGEEEVRAYNGPQEYRVQSCLPCYPSQDLVAQESRIAKISLKKHGSWPVDRHVGMAWLVC